MNETVRIGLIGAGQIGTQHLNNYSQIPEAKVVAVADLFPEKVETARQKFDIPDGYLRDPMARWAASKDENLVGVGRARSRLVCVNPS